MILSSYYQVWTNTCIGVTIFATYQPVYRGSVVKKVMIKTVSYSDWRQCILEIIHMVLDGFHELPVINLTRFINTPVNFKFIFLQKQKEKKKKTPQLDLSGFYAAVVYNLLVFFVEKALHCCWTHLSAQLSLSAPLRQKQSRLFTVMSS